MTGAHAFFAPSSAALWRKCSLAPHMVQLFPEADSERSAEGTEAHSHAAYAAKGGNVFADHTDPDMARGARMWAEAIGGATYAVHSPFVERRVAGPEPDYYGTPDYCDGALVADYKFGRIVVDVVDNAQLLAYAELADPEPRPLELLIVQPRAYHPEGPVRRHKLTTEEVAVHFAAARAARQRARDDPQATPGTHCLYCPGRAACRGLRDAALADLDVLQGATLAETLQRAHEHQTMLEGLVTGLEAEAIVRLERGERVGNYEMRPGRGSFTWNAPAPDVVSAVALATGRNIGTIEVCTPTQAIKEHKLPADVINTLATRHKGAPTLTLVPHISSFKS